MNKARHCIGVLLAALGSCSGAQAQSADTAHLPGASIYRAGLLPGGSELQGLRAPDLKVSGGDAACTNCHRRSGLGEIEGRISIPPISGAYLFHPRAHDKDDFDLPFVDSMRPEREPY